jgi:hypothetical protein
MNPPAIHAEITGSDTCSALGITVCTTAPVLEICRALLAAGHDPATPLEACRGDMLCLRVRAIGEVAGLEINARGSGLIARPAVRTAPPIRKPRPPIRRPIRPARASAAPGRTPSPRRAAS